MHTSKIEWVLNPDNKTLGKIWNPITGCLNGCEYCYARRLAYTRLEKMYLANDNVAPPYFYAPGNSDPTYDPFYPRFWPERLNEPYPVVSPKNGWQYYASKPKGIFTVDMGDLFGDWVPWQWQAQIFQTIHDNPQHRFYLLTKQPQNLAKFSPFPDNCYVGVSATDYGKLNAARYHLQGIEATVKYLSMEPLLGRMADKDGRTGRIGDGTGGSLKGMFGYDKWVFKHIDQVILGGKSGPQPFYPPEAWIEEIEQAADRAGVKVFEKNNLRKDWQGRQPRQEVPNV